MVATALFHQILPIVPEDLGVVFFGLSNVFEEHFFSAVAGLGHEHRGRDLAVVVRGEGPPSDVGGDQLPFLKFALDLPEDLDLLVLADVDAL